ncbi:MAG TPA: CRTAC1 family protein [Dongiaceae bacterium]|nr:CRTAC1 family protein [Dongiaceae bacterium]
MKRRPVVAALLLNAATLVGCGRGPTEAPPTPAGRATPGAAPGAAAADFPNFVDVTAAQGITFRHVNGATGQKFMMETLGSGVCVFDYDGDGREDLYFVQSGALPGYAGAVPPAALYRNVGGGRFEDVTTRAGVGAAGLYGMGCVAADVDGDGDRDLLVTGYGRNVFYRNRGDGTFADDTRGAGLTDTLWSASATFFDADRDGDLDLYVTHYVDFDLKNSLYCGENRPGYRTVCHPKNFDPEPDVYYRNRGDGRFEDRSAAAGIVDRTGKGLGVVAGDVDDDGDEDLYVANDDTPNFLWRNRGDGTFEEIAEAAGCALSEDGVPQAGMGTDMADYDGDGRMDLFVTNLSEEMNELYRNEGDGTFSNATFSSGLGPPSLLSLAFGTFFFDADRDGDLDLFVGNGHIIDNIALYSDTITFEQPPFLFRNLGGGRFDLPRPGPALATPRVVRGAVPFDFDDDGDEDLVLAQNDRPAILLRNDGPARGHWIGVDLAGAAPNRDAIGARVEVLAGARRQARLRRTATSYASQPDGRILFGLGDATTIDRLAVRWPGARDRELFATPGIDRYVTLTRGTGTKEARP